ncbi:magnesium chelatase domain-containing protein, partial [Enterococcus faecalis]|uniref:magnesium chelatase domain-containing protein n=1 Tax=Enterococcus faecalis TaxID=1351 RepID=UPI003CC572F1
GVKINEPAIDLAVAISIASSYKVKGTSSSECFSGEIGLTCEIRRVNSIEQRVREALKLGFTKVYVTKKNLGGWEAPE